MRAALVLVLVGAVAAAFTALAASGGRGHATQRSAVAAAIERTSAAHSVRYAIRVRMTHGGKPYTLHIAGQSSARAISVRMRLGDLRLRNGTALPGADGAAVLAGPYLYERAPSSVVVFGSIRWLRMNVVPKSPDLQAVRALTPTPILRVLRAARIVATSARTFRGTIGYDSPAVAANLSHLTGGIQFRAWRISGSVGRNGLVSSVTLRGRTADTKTEFVLRAHLSGFGRHVRIRLPKPGTFMDESLSGVAA